MSDQGQTLPSDSARVRINVCCCTKSGQIADTSRTTKRARNGLTHCNMVCENLSFAGRPAGCLFFAVVFESCRQSGLNQRGPVVLAVAFVLVVLRRNKALDREVRRPLQ